MRYSTFALPLYMLLFIYRYFHHISFNAKKDTFDDRRRVRNIGRYIIVHVGKTIRAFIDFICRWIFGCRRDFAYSQSMPHFKFVGK